MLGMLVVVHAQRVRPLSNHPLRRHRIGMRHVGVGPREAPLRALATLKIASLLED